MTAAAYNVSVRIARELPIPFMTELVPHVLDDSKTMTRRVPRLPFADDPSVTVHVRQTAPAELTCSCSHLSDPVPVVKVVRPRWSVGDRLWVKEALRPTPAGYVSYLDGYHAKRGSESVKWPWKVKKLGAMYCPRWASRITLEVLAVRFERLQLITEVDAVAEGVADVAEFKRIWLQLHGQESWDADPFVSVTSFRRVRP